MAEQSWLKVWARTIGMPIGETDTDPPKDPAISKTNVKRALAFRTFWICLLIIACLMIIAGNGRSLGWW